MSAKVPGLGERLYTSHFWKGHQVRFIMSAMIVGKDFGSTHVPLNLLSLV